MGTMSGGDRAEASGGKSRRTSSGVSAKMMIGLEAGGGGEEGGAAMKGAGDSDVGGGQRREEQTELRVPTGAYRFGIPTLHKPHRHVGPNVHYMVGPTCKRGRSRNTRVRIKRAQGETGRWGPLGDDAVGWAL